MSREFEHRSGIWLTEKNQMFSKDGANRLKWLISQTPRPSEWLFPGGTITINLFEAASYCFVNGQFLGAMVMGLSYIEQTLTGIFTAAGRKELENAGVELLAREAMSLAIFNQKDFEIVKEASKKRNAKFIKRKLTGPENDEFPTIGEDEQESAVYEEDGRKVMSVVIHLLDKKLA